MIVLRFVAFRFSAGVLFHQFSVFRCFFVFRCSAGVPCSGVPSFIVCRFSECFSLFNMNTLEQMWEKHIMEKTCIV